MAPPSTFPPIRGALLPHRQAEPEASDPLSYAAPIESEYWDDDGTPEFREMLARLEREAWSWKVSVSISKFSVETPSGPLNCTLAAPTPENAAPEPALLLAFGKRGCPARKV